MSVLSVDDLFALVRRHDALPGADACAVAGAQAESGGDPVGPPGDNGRSWGLWQMEQGAGLGGNYSADQLQDPDFAASIMVPIYGRFYQQGQTLGYEGEQLARYTYMWTERPFGFPALDCPAADRFAACWQNLGNNMPPDPPSLVYNGDIPAERQVQSWVCSIRTATFMVKSIGLDIDAGQMESLMVPTLVDAAEGLHDGTGRHLATFLASLTHCPTAAYQSVSWGWLQTHAGTAPIGMGSYTMNHWLAVRRVNDDGSLALANPAPAWQGVGDVMDEASFQRWAPWNAIAITLPTAPEEDDLSAAERAELEQLRTVKVYCDTLTGSILPSALGTIEAAAQGGKGAKWAKVREQCAAVRTQAGI